MKLDSASKDASQTNPTYNCHMGRPDIKRNEVILTSLVISVFAGMACLYVVFILLTSPAQKDTNALSVAKTEISELTSAANQFRLDCDRYPTTKEGFAALYKAPAGANGWHGPYLKEPIPAGPDGHPYEYHNPSPSGQGYEVKVSVRGMPVTGGSDN